MLQEVPPDLGVTASLSDAAVEVEQTLQRESYHEPKQPLVEETASDVRIVAPEDLGEISDGTILRTLELWSATVGPVKFQRWQSAYFG